MVSKWLKINDLGRGNMLTTYMDCYPILTVSCRCRARLRLSFLPVRAEPARTRKGLYSERVFFCPRKADVIPRALVKRMLGKRYARTTQLTGLSTNGKTTSVSKAALWFSLCLALLLRDGSPELRLQGPAAFGWAFLSLSGFSFSFNGALLGALTSRLTAV